MTITHFVRSINNLKWTFFQLHARADVDGNVDLYVDVDFYVDIDLYVDEDLYVDLDLNVGCLLISNCPCNQMK